MAYMDIDNNNVLLQDQYKKEKENNESAAYQSSVENGAHADRLTRFNSPKGGHGFAAEQANDLIDKLHFKDSKIVGDDNKKDGPDRISEGTLIQTKGLSSFIVGKPTIAH